MQTNASAVDGVTYVGASCGHTSVVVHVDGNYVDAMSSLALSIVEPCVPPGLIDGGFRGFTEGSPLLPKYPRVG